MTSIYGGFISCTFTTNHATTQLEEAPTFEEIRLDPASRHQWNTDIARVESLRLTQRLTVGSAAGPAPREEWLPFGDGKDYPPLLPDPERYVVGYTGVDDPMHPHNWSTTTKVILSSILAYNTFTASFASAIFPAAVGDVATLGATLYVLGFSAGPTIWAPASELIGRRWPITIGMLGYSIFTIGTATAKDKQTLFITRFFAGLFAASPLAIVPAAFADMYDNSHRGIAIAMFAMAVFVGPFASPFTGGFIVMSYLGWRWTMYMSAIMGFLGVILLVLFYKETYAPVVLVEKAATLRRQTHNWGIHSKQDEVELDLHELITTNFSRPFRMLLTESIVFLVTIYMSFIYGLILPFIGLIVGELAGGVYTLIDAKKYMRKLRANNDIPIPEWRLPPAIAGGVAFTIGRSGVFTGFGIYVIFLQCFNYLIDSYLQFAALVFAANTILRSAVGACFPLFARQLFTNLGAQWAGTLLGCLSFIMIPIPLAFMKSGPGLRKRNKFAPPAGLTAEVQAR
ncbi:major facilitator superfamily domain-containing protein [Aspergillus desertorum]